MAHPDSPVHPFDGISAKYTPSQKSQDSIGNQAGITTKGLFDAKSTLNSPASISPESIDLPAIILDRDLHIVWQNPSAEVQIWQGIVTRQLLKNHCDIFDLLLTQDFQQSISNWRQWVGFFIQQAMVMLPVEELEKVFNAKQDPNHEILLALLSDYTPETKRDDSCLHIHQVLNNDQKTYFATFGIQCDTGRLIVFQPQTCEKNGTLPLNRRSDHFSLRKKIYPGGQEAKSSFSVIVAQLNHSETFSCEMLDVDYSRLLMRVSEIVKGTIEQFEGLFSQFEPAKFIGHFFSDNHKEMDTYKVIQCALKLKHKMENLSREWKIKKGWLHSIELNMGIEFGYNYVTVMPSSLGDSCITLGNSLSDATFYASLAKDGQIWVSKQIIDHFPQDKLDALRFGIFRNDHSQQLFIPNCFSRIEDLQNINPSPYNMEGGLKAKPVTQVFDFSN